MSDELKINKIQATTLSLNKLKIDSIEFGSGITIEVDISEEDLSVGIEKVMKILSSAGNKFKEVIKNTFTSISTKSKTVFDNIVKIGKATLSKVGGFLVSGISSGLSAFGNFGIQVGQFMAKNIMDGLKASLEIGPELQASLDETKTLLDSIKTSFSDAFMGEYLEEGMVALGGFNEILSTLSLDLGSAVNFDEVVGLIGTAIGDLINYVLEQAPMFVEMFSNLFSGLANGILENKENIKTSIATLVTSIVGFFAENLPLILDIAAQIVIGLGEGLVKSLPKLVEGVKNLISTVVRIFKEDLPNFVGNITESLKQFFTEAFNSVETSGFLDGWFNKDDIIGSLGNLFDIIADSLLDFFNSLPEKITKAFGFVSKGIDDNSDGVISKVREVLSLLIDKFIEYYPKFYKSAIDIVLSLIKGLVETIPKVIKAAGKLILSIIGLIGEKLPDILAAGVEIVGSLAVGLIDAIFIVLDAIGDLWNDILNYFDGVDLKEVGGNIIEGLKNGIVESASKVLDAMKNMGTNIINTIEKNLGINSPSKVMKEIGQYTGEGLVVGINSKAKEVNKSAENLGATIVDGAKKSLDIKGSNSKTFNQLGEYITKDLADGIGGNTKEVIKSIDELESDIIKSTKAWIDEYKGEISSLDGQNLSLGVESKAKVAIDSWKYVLDNYKLTGEEIVAIQSEINNQMDALGKEQYEQSVNWIESRKKSNQLSLVEEYEAWQRVQSRYAEGSDERIKADEKVMESKNAMLDRQKEILEEMKLAEDAYGDAVEARANEIFKSFGLFSELTKKENIASETLINNLQTQVKTMEEWSDDLQSLAKKGIDEGLLNELQKMGPSAYAEIDALNSMTESELTTYENLWKEKNQLAREQAIYELQGLRSDTNTEIENLNSELDRLLSAGGETAGQSFASSLLTAIQDGLDSASGFINQWFGNMGMSGLGVGDSNTKSNTFNVSIDANNLNQVADVVNMFNSLETAYNAY